jgi:serine/threonine protein phosphatase PrpC
LLIDRHAKTARWAHAGDTRLYLIRQGCFYRQTLDHSLMASMIAAGLITAEEAATHPKRHMLLTALGVARTPEIAIGDSDGELMAGDTFILCTDGMWEHLPPAALLSRGDFSSPAAWLTDLVATVQRHAPESADNCSAIVVWLDE